MKFMTALFALSGNQNLLMIFYFGKLSSWALKLINVSMQNKKWSIIYFPSTFVTKEFTQ